MFPSISIILELSRYGTNSKSTYLLNFEPPEPPDDLNFWVGGFGGLDCRLLALVLFSWYVFRWFIFCWFFHRLCDDLFRLSIFLYRIVFYLFRL